PADPRRTHPSGNRDAVLSCRQETSRQSGDSTKTYDSKDGGMSGGKQSVRHANGAMFWTTQHGCGQSYAFVPVRATGACEAAHDCRSAFPLCIWRASTCLGPRVGYDHVSTP